MVKQSKYDGFFLGCTNYKPDRTGCERLLNAGQYEFWLNSAFGIEDASEYKPSYFVPKNEVSAPKMQKDKGVGNKKGCDIKTISYKEVLIDNEVFRIIIDSEGNTLTDMLLLEQLRIMRSSVAMEKKLPSYYLLHNNILVLIATDKPTTREELMSISGFGARKWDIWGEDILRVVSNYLNK